MKLIVGLGNPEDQYNGTRHNLGFDVLDDLLRKWTSVSGSQEWEDNKKLKSWICKIKYNDQDVILAKPQTYMNNSGMAVRLLSDFYKVIADDLIVIHDELDLMLGHLKVREGGSAAGHHGVESIISALSTDKFIRIRLGIGPQQKSGLAKLAEHHQRSLNVDHFVLEKFLPNEKTTVKRMLKRSIQAIETLLDKGLAVAQTQFN